MRSAGPEPLLVAAQRASLAIERIEQFARRIDQSQQHVAVPTLVSRPGGSGGLHYGVAMNSCILDFTVGPGSSYSGWQTASLVGSVASASGLLSATFLELGFQASMAQAAADYNAAVFKILRTAAARNQELAGQYVGGSFARAADTAWTAAGAPPVVNNVTTAMDNFLDSVYGCLASAVRQHLLASFDLPDWSGDLPPKDAELLSSSLLENLLSAQIGLDDIMNLLRSQPSSTFWAIAKVLMVTGRPSMARLVWVVEVFQGLADMVDFQHETILAFVRLESQTRSQLIGELQHLHGRISRIADMRFLSCATMGVLSCVGALSCARMRAGAGIIAARTFNDFAQGQQVTFHANPGVRVDSTAIVQRRAAATMGAAVDYEMSTCNCEHYAMWILTGSACPNRTSQAQMVWACAGMILFILLQLLLILFAVMSEKAAPEPLVVIPATILGGTGLAAAFPGLVGYACALGIGTPTILAPVSMAASIMASLGIGGAVAAVGSVGATLGVGGTIAGSASGSAIVAGGAAAAGSAASGSAMFAGGAAAAGSAASGSAIVTGGVAAAVSGTAPVVVVSGAGGVAAVGSGSTAMLATGASVAGTASTASSVPTIAVGSVTAGGAGASANRALASSRTGAQGKFDALLNEFVDHGPYERHLVDVMVADGARQ